MKIRSADGGGYQTCVRQSTVLDGGHFGSPTKLKSWVLEALVVPETGHFLSGTETDTRSHQGAIAQERNRREDLPAKPGLGQPAQGRNCQPDRDRKRTKFSAESGIEEKTDLPPSTHRMQRHESELRPESAPPSADRCETAGPFLPP